MVSFDFIVHKVIQRVYFGLVLVGFFLGGLVVFFLATLQVLVSVKVAILVYSF